MQNSDAHEHEIYYQLLREEREALREAKSFQQWKTLFDNKRSRIRAIKNFNASKARIESREQIDSTILQEEEQCLKEFDDVVVNHYATNTQQTRMVDAFRLSDENNQPFYDVTVVITLTRLNKDAKQLPRECFLTYRLQDDIIERQAQLGPQFNTQNYEEMREEKIEIVEHNTMNVTRIVTSAPQEQHLQDDIIECQAQLESPFVTRNCEGMREIKIGTAEYPRTHSSKAQIAATKKRDASGKFIKDKTQSTKIASSLTTIMPQDTVSVTRIVTSAPQEQQTTLQKSPKTRKSFQMQIVSQEDMYNQRLCSNMTPMRKTKHEIQRTRFTYRKQQRCIRRVTNTDVTNNTGAKDFIPKSKRTRKRSETSTTKTKLIRRTKAQVAATRKRDASGKFIKDKTLHNRLSKPQGETATNITPVATNTNREGLYLATATVPIITAQTAQMSQGRS